MGYVTYQEVIRATPDIQWHADHYAWLTELIGVAGELVDRATRRYAPGLEAYQAATTATARYFTSASGPCLAIDECVSVSAVAVRWGAETAWSTLESTHYVTYPYNHLPIVRLDLDRRTGQYAAWPAATYPQNVRVTARWGYSATPPEVVQLAVVMQVAIWWRRGATLFAAASPVGELGAPGYERKLDAGVQALLFDSGLVRKDNLF